MGKSTLVAIEFLMNIIVTVLFSLPSL